MKYENLSFRHSLQPIYDLSKNEIASYELLLRLENGKSAFPVIRQLEQNDEVHKLDLDNLRFAINLLKDKRIDKPIAVNFSGKSLSRAMFCVQALKEFESNPELTSMLTIEVTETEKIENRELAVNFLSMSQEHGAKVSADDFGAGYMNMSYINEQESLGDFKYNYIKIDGSLIKNIFSQESQEKIKELMKSYEGKPVKFTAEFIENQEILDKVNELGIERGQGYHLARPFMIEPLRDQEYHN